LIKLNNITAVVAKEMLQPCTTYLVYTGLQRHRPAENWLWIMYSKL